MTKRVSYRDYAVDIQPPEIGIRKMHIATITRVGDTVKLASYSMRGPGSISMVTMSPASTDTERSAMRRAVRRAWRNHPAGSPRSATPAEQPQETESEALFGGHLFTGASEAYTCWVANGGHTMVIEGKSPADVANEFVENFLLRDEVPHRPVTLGVYVIKATPQERETPQRFTFIRREYYDMVGVGVQP